MRAEKDNYVSNHIFERRINAMLFTPHNQKSYSSKLIAIIIVGMLLVLAACSSNTAPGGEPLSTLRPGDFGPDIGGADNSDEEKYEV